MLYLYFKAPFGTFRPFQSVEMLATTAFLTHSAAYGLLLGLAGIERKKKEAYIEAQIAIGVKCQTQGVQHLDINDTPNKMKPQLPRRGRVFQQLHRIPQGSDKKRKEEKERAKGSKSERIGVYWREVLIGLEGYIGLKDELLQPLVERGINAPHTLDYFWGLPFMGDNNFFVERLDVRDKPEPCCWFYRYDGKPLQGDKRLHYSTVWTDYKTNLRSDGYLFALTEEKGEPPSEAWVPIRPSDEGK
jgi:CRISPR-associated protein Cas5t